MTNFQMDHIYLYDADPLFGNNMPTFIVRSRTQEQKAIDEIYITPVQDDATIELLSQAIIATNNLTTKRVGDTNNTQIAQLQVDSDDDIFADAKQSIPHFQSLTIEIEPEKELDLNSYVNTVLDDKYYAQLESQMKMEEEQKKAKQDKHRKMLEDMEDHYLIMKEPERILKRNTSGPQIKYQVKWKGFEELTWEFEEAMQKHKDLIEDYNYFVLTGERYNEQQMESIKSQFQNSQPKTAVKRAQPRPTQAAAPIPAPSAPIQEEITQVQQQPTKIQKKNDKLQNHDGEKKQLMLENQQQMVILHQQSHKISNILSVKQNEMTKKIASLYATPEDQISTVKLQIADSSLLFRIQWKIRPDGSTPLPEYYQYDQFKLVAPLLYIQFIEQCFFQAQPKDSDIKFEAPLQDVRDRALMIAKIFNKDFQDNNYVEEIPPQVRVKPEIQLEKIMNQQLQQIEEQEQQAAQSESNKQNTEPTLIDQNSVIPLPPSNTAQASSE